MSTLRSGLFASAVLMLGQVGCGAPVPAREAEQHQQLVVADLVDLDNVPTCTSASLASGLYDLHAVARAKDLYIARSATQEACLVSGIAAPPVDGLRLRGAASSDPMPFDPGPGVEAPSDSDPMPFHPIGDPNPVDPTAGTSDDQR